MLHSHPRIYSHGEVFARYERETAGAPVRLEPLRYLRRDMRRAGRRHYVFSLHFLRGQHLRSDLVDMDLPGFLDAIRPLGIERFALLERRNSLRVIVSKYAGELRGTWHPRPGDEIARPSFRLDPGAVEFAGTPMSLVAWLEEFERAYSAARLLVADRGGTSLTYEEDVLPDPRIGYARLCATLGLPPVEVEVPLTRANPFRVRNIVANFGEIERELRGTRFAWMLEAD